MTLDAQSSARRGKIESSRMPSPLYGFTIMVAYCPSLSNHGSHVTETANPFSPEVGPKPDDKTPAESEDQTLIPRGHGSPEPYYSLCENS